MFWTILTILLLTLWFAVVAKNTAYYTWLWQLKEYRSDRLKSALKEKPKIKWLKTYGWLKFILFAILFSYFLFTPAYYDPHWTHYSIVAVFLVYGLEIGWGLRAYSKKQFKKPTFTPKALIIFGATIASALALLFALKPFPVPPKVAIGISAWSLGIERLLPAVVLFWVTLFYFPTEFYKRKLTKKAESKINSLDNLIRIGITGSFGKSTTKDFLSEILTSKFVTLKTPKNINTDIGIAKLILNKLTKKHEVFVLEAGAYKKGEIARIAQMTKPHMGFITGISPQHMSLFGTTENIKKAKYELIQSLPANGTAFFNGENQDCVKLAQKTDIPTILYGRREKAKTKLDVEADKIKMEPQKTTFRLKTEDESQKATLNLPGKQYITNFTGACACAYKLGMSLEEIARIASQLKAPPNSLKLRKGVHHTAIVDDTYSANPDGVMAACQYLNQAYPNRRKIIVLRTLIELGSKAPEIHKNLGQKMGKICQKLYITTEEFAPTVKQGALEGGMTKNDIFIIPHPEKMIQTLRENIKKDDVILIEGRINQKIKEFLLETDNHRNLHG